MNNHFCWRNSSAWSAGVLAVSYLSVAMTVAQQSPPSQPGPPPPAEEAAARRSAQAATAPPTAADARPMARGIVFLDCDHNGRFDDHDLPFAGVKVSNGVDIVTTDDRGAYALPIDEESILFVIKPSGFRTALDKNNLPKFYYVHKPNGSPRLQYAGSPPTGPLPRSIDFPLYRQEEPESFQLILFGDPQPRNMQEVDYITRDVIAELIGSRASFGVSLGDLAFDDLNTLEPLNQAVALIGLPWYNVIGNHDINFDASSRRHVNETFERIYGPTYYSFDYGQVHFIVLDSIDWIIPGNSHEQPHYAGGLGPAQLAFVERDLSLIPASQMVVLLMHIPLTDIADCQSLFRLIEQRPLCVSVSAHLHRHQHRYLDQRHGWQGDKPHHHIVNVTVSGSWWSGQKDERGIPHTTMADGAPNGYSILSMDRNGYRLDFKAAGRSAEEQLGIRMPAEVEAGSTKHSDVWVNVYNGSEKSTTQMRVDNVGPWLNLQRELAIDPQFQRLWDREQQMNPPPEPALTKPKPSTHLWHGKLPAGIEPGMHLLQVRSIDRHGRTYTARQPFRVVGQPDRQQTVTAGQ